MFSFIGRSQNRVDAKGRVSLPADFRKVYEKAGGGVVLVPNARQKLSVEGYTEKGYQQLLEQIDSNDWSAAQKMAVTRRLAGNARPIPIDDNGRIVLPESIRAYALIADEAFFVGHGATFQIWNPERHAAVEAEEEAEADALIAGMSWKVSNR